MPVRLLPNLRRLPAHLLLAALPGTAPAMAANMTFDSVGGPIPNGAVDDGSGTWSTNIPLPLNWTTTGGTTNTAWTSNNDNAFFGGATGTAGTVTLGSAITAASLTFNARAGNYYTLTGNTLTISNGITANANATINSAVTLGANQIWTTAGTGATLVVGGAVGGSRTLTKDGTGTLVLSGANTWTGTTVVNAGVLEISADNNLGNTGNVLQIQNAATLRANGTFTLASTRSVQLGNGGGTDTANLEVTAGNTLTYGGILANQASGNDSLIKTGAGSLVLSGSNNYKGTTTVSAGVLVAANATALGTTAAGTTVASGTTLNLQAAVGTETLSIGGNGVGGNGALVNSSATAASLSGAVTLTANTSIGGSGTGGLTLSGAIGDGGAGYGITKVGAGTLTLSGAAANTFTGLTTVSAGELDFNKTAGVNAAGGNVTVSGGTLKWLANEQLSNAPTTTLTLSAGGTVDLNGKTETTGIFLNSGGIFQTGQGGQLILTGPNTLTWAGGTNTVNAGATVSDNHIVITGGTNTVQGQAGPLPGLSGGVLRLDAGGIGLEMTGATLTLNSDLLSAGKLVLNGNVTTFASATTASIANGGALAVSGTVDLGGGTRTFTVADGSAATDLSIGAVVSNGGLTKAGAGTMTLSGTNTHTGVTTVNAGRLSVGTIGNGAVAGNLGQASNAASNLVLGGGTLQYTGATASTDRAFTLATGTVSSIEVTLAAANLTISGAAAATTGSLAKAGAGTLTLSGANQHTGSTAVSAGALNIQNAAALGTTAAGTSVAAGAALQIQNDITVGAEALTLNGTGVAGDGALRNISGANAYGGTVTLGSAARINSDAGNLTLNAPTAVSGAGFGLTVGGAGNTTVSGVISGTGTALTKDGAGTLTISGTNTYTGSTTVNEGILNVQGNQSAANGSWSLLPNGANAVTVNWQAGSTISAASVSVIGNVIPTRAANLNVAGQVTNNGAMTVGKTASVTILNGGNWTQNGAAFVNPAPSTGFSATLTVQAGGTYTYASSSNFDLSPSSGSSGSATVDVAGGTFVTGRAFANTVATSTGSALLRMSSGGTLRLTADVAQLMTTAGSTSSVALGTGGGILDTNGHATALDRSVADVAGQTGSLTKTGAGMLTLSGANTYTGTTTVSTGTLVVNGTHAAAGAANSSYAIAGGATLAGDGTIVLSGGGTDAVTAVAGSFVTAGTVATAGGIGSLDITAPSIALAGTYLCDINMAAGTASMATPDGTLADVVRLNGDVNLTGMTLQLRGNAVTGAPAAGTHYAVKLLSWTDATPTGVVADGANVAFTGISLRADQSIVRWGNAYYLVPEPASFALLSLGCLLLLRRPSRRRGR